jgi:flagellar motility protein MotE (MotC chaperone)
MIRKMYRTTLKFLPAGVLVATVIVLLSGNEAGIAQSAETEKGAKEAPTAEASKETEKESAKESKVAGEENESHFAEKAGGPEDDAEVGAGNICLPDQATVEDLRKQRDRVEAKQKELAARESDLKARELALQEELKKIQSAREDIAKIEGAKKVESEEKVTKLVETFETMSPKAASQLLVTVDETLAVAAMTRISTAKLAKIMNIMETSEPAKSAKLTELLAGVVRAKVAMNGGSGTSSSAKNRKIASTPSKDVAAATDSSAKGGDKNDGQSEQRNSNSSSQPESGSRGDKGEPKKQGV